MESVGVAINSFWGASQSLITPGAHFGHGTQRAAGCFSLTKSSPRQRIEFQHKALLFMASVIVKTFLMAIVSSNVFCGSINPAALFMECGANVAFVGGSTAAVAIMGALFGYYLIRLKSFNQIFPRVMKADFVITAMYFGVAFTDASLVAGKVMIWLFGMWILGMLLAPFNKEMTALKTVAEYGSIVALGALLAAHFIPELQEYGQAYTLGMMVSSVTGVFGEGRK